MQDVTLRKIPEYDILEEDRLAAVLGSADRLLCKLLSEASESGNWNLRESVWPALGALKARDAKYLSIKPVLVLIPLSRIGAKGGFSGSHILLGYFSDGTDTTRLYSSLPLVVKLSERDGSEHKLRSEYTLAGEIRPYLAYRKDSFAVPIYLDVEDRHYDVLWSPFALPELIEWGTRLKLEAKDMRQLVDPMSPDLGAARSLIESVFSILTPLHTRAGLGGWYLRSYADEYRPYLRDFGEKWGTEWKAIWGTEQNTADLGRDDWANPIWVQDKLSLVAKTELLCGAVHGDLHPGNILYSTPESPSLIDFGWADSDAHVAKDFVLLECNLRFTYLPGDLPPADVRVLSRWIGQGTPCEPLRDNRTTEVQKTISIIRDTFRERIGDRDWDVEYVIPLFLVSFGLLRYVSDYKNQIAARLTVLELATYIRSSVLPKFSPVIPNSSSAGTTSGSVGAGQV
jgi:hypothetical protein